MGLETKTGFVGLVTNVGDLSAPPGALSSARNVVVRRAGALEQRPGTTAHATVTATGELARKIIPYQPDTVLAYEESSALKWRSVGTNSALELTTLDSNTLDPQPLRMDLIPDACARGNLYVGWQGGTFRYTGSGDPSVTGVPPVVSVHWSTTVANVSPNAAVGNGDKVAYRIVSVKEVGDLIVRSAPCGAFPVANAAGASRAVSLVLAYSDTPEMAAAFDYVEIYRTRNFPSASTIDEECQLIETVRVGDFTAGIYTYTDNTADSARGATLYTSPSREGAEGANALPPACGALALFRRSLFFGNVAGPRRIVVSAVFGDRTGSATGTGYRLYTGTITSGSANITGLASTVGLERGMVVVDPPAHFPAGTYVTNISGATVTMSQPATSSWAASPINFCDAIAVDGLAIWAPADASFSYEATSLSDGKYNAYLQTPAKGGYTYTFVIETMLAGPAQMGLVAATHGSDYDVELPDYASGVPMVMEYDAWPHAIMWSKPDEPEHVPVVNYAFVGDSTGEILALETTRDALFVFKTDGIWRVTGDNGRWRVDPFDPTTRCVLPSSVAKMSGRIYALTNRGFVAVGDDGVRVISAPISDQLKRMVYELAANGAPYLVTAGAGTLGHASAANEVHFEYACLVGGMLSEESSAITGALIYNEQANAWTSWDWSASGAFSVYPSALAYSPKDASMLVGQFSVPGIIKRMAEPGKLLESSFRPYASDGSALIDVLTINASNRITYSPATSLEVGDVVIDVSGSGTVRTVVTVHNSSSVTLSGAVVIGEACAARPITCSVQPAPFTDADYSNKLWLGVYAAFSRLYGTHSSTCSTRSSIALSPPFNPQALDVESSAGATGYMLGCRIRADMSDEAARGWLMQCQLSWSMAFGSVVLEAISAEYREGRSARPNLAVKA